MNTEYNYLITLTNGNSLIQVAVRFKSLTQEQQDFLKYWGEPDSQEWISDNLPDYVSNVGPVVKVEELFAII